tara:strand:- start:1324 stop:1767 length:444 start_codon:yes stop_codon:yes gene_type:complete
MYRSFLIIVILAVISTVAQADYFGGCTDNDRFCNTLASCQDIVAEYVPWAISGTAPTSPEFAAGGFPYCQEGYCLAYNGTDVQCQRDVGTTLFSVDPFTTIDNCVTSPATKNGFCTKFGRYSVRKMQEYIAMGKLNAAGFTNEGYDF